MPRVSVTVQIQLPERVRTQSAFGLFFKMKKGHRLTKETAVCLAKTNGRFPGKLGKMLCYPINTK